MSRSKRKPYYTDQQGGGCGVKHAKRKAAKRVRHAEEVGSGGEYRKHSCPYDIRDWSFYSPKEAKAFRK